MEDVLLTPAQVARRLQVTTRTVSDWLRSGRLKGVRVGRLWRVPAPSLDAMLGGVIREEGRAYSTEQIQEFIDADQLDPDLARRAQILLR